MKKHFYKIFRASSPPAKAAPTANGKAYGGSTAAHLVENYLKDPSNKLSKLYPFLIEELGQVQTIHEEYKGQLAIVKPKIG